MTSPYQMVQALAMTAGTLTKITLWNSWSAQNDARLAALLEKLSEKAVLAAEALEQAAGDCDASEIERALIRSAALQSDADGLVQKAFALLNQSRVALLSREQTRALTRAIRGILDAVAASSERMLGSTSPIASPNGLAQATTLRRAVEQIRLAVSGLRASSDRCGALRSCAHIRALQREGALLRGHASPANEVCRTIGEGLDRCGEAADVLEHVFGFSKRQTNG